MFTAVAATPDSVSTIQLGNGNQGVLVANYNNDSVSVLKVNNDGTLTKLTDLATGGGPNGFGVGDFNGDGIADFAIGDFKDSDITIYLGQDDGSFVLKGSFSTGSGPANTMAIGDFDNDTNLDLATANFNTGTVSVLKGNGDGTFQSSVEYAAGPGAISVFAEDFEHNGFLDLVTANYNDNSVSVLANNGDGTFAAPVTYSVGTNPWFVTGGIFNDNGFSIVTANFGGGVSVLLANGDGTFQNAVNYAAGTNPTGVQVADMNGDGIFDLVSSNYGSNDVSVLLGNPGGTFQSATNLAAGTGPNGLTIADLNNDGKPDLLVADQDGNGVAAIMNQSLQGTEGQSFSGTLANITDSDGTLTTSDLSAVVSWGDGNVDNLGSSAFAENGDGSFSLNGTHTYDHAGIYTVSLTINDTDGDTSSTTTTVSIADALLSAQPPAPVFAPTQPNVVVGNTPDAVFGCSLDHMGTSYLLVANYGDDTITVLRGSGETFSPFGTYEVGGGPNGFAVADVNNDGNMDVVVSDFETGEVSVLLGNGDGTLQASVEYGVGSGPANVTAVGDFDNNGTVDIAVADFNDDTVSVLMGNGDGTFSSAVTYAAGPGAIGVVTGDFNQDGHLDLATANNGNSSVSVLLNNGDGTFASPISYSVGANPWFIQAGDLRGTGGVDIVTANFGGSVSVLLGNDDGTFQSATTYSAGSNPTGVAIADMNHDSIADIVTSNYGSNDVSILRGNGDGTFQSPQSFAAGSGPNGLTVVDFNNDGSADIAVANQNGNDVTVLYAQRFTSQMGQPSTVSTSFTDANPNSVASDFTAIAWWGDGTSTQLSPGAITPNGSGGFDITVSHIYLSTGFFSGTIQIGDGGSQEAFADFTTYVSDSLSSGTVTINGFNNSTAATVSFNDGTGPSETVDTLLTQFNVTYTAGAASTTFNTFCIDLLHTVTAGQTYAVIPTGSFAGNYTNANALAYLEQVAGQEGDLSSNPNEAAALQIALWDESLNNHTPTFFSKNNADGSYNSGDPTVFSIRLDSLSQADQTTIMNRTNQLLQLASIAPDPTKGSFLKSQGIGQTLLAQAPKPPAGGMTQEDIAKMRQQLQDLAQRIKDNKDIQDKKRDGFLQGIALTQKSLVGAKPVVLVRPAMSVKPDRVTQPTSTKKVTVNIRGSGLTKDATVYVEFNGKAVYNGAANNKDGYTFTIDKDLQVFNPTTQPAGNVDPVNEGYKIFIWIYRDGKLWGVSQGYLPVYPAPNP